MYCCKIEENCNGVNDAPRRWRNILDKALRTHGMIPTRTDRCCYVLCSIQSRERAWEHWGPRAIAQQNGTKDAFTESRQQSEMEAALEKTLDPIAGSPSMGKSVAGIIHLFVDDLFGVGSEDWNDVTFTRTENSLDTRFPKTGRTLKSVKAVPLTSWKKSQRNETGRSPPHSLNAHNVQKPTGTDNLATE